MLQKVFSQYITFIKISFKHYEFRIKFNSTISLCLCNYVCLIIYENNIFADILPWDKDGDIAYLIEDISQMVALLNSTFLHNNSSRITIEKNQISTTLEASRNYGFQFCIRAACIDIFPYGHTKNLKGIYRKHLLEPNPSRNSIVKVNVDQSGLAQLFGCATHHKYDVIFPIQQCEFGGKMICCPNKPEIMLQEQYCFSYKSNVRLPYKPSCYFNPANFRRFMNIS